MSQLSSQVVDGGGMIASNTESGYLSDSVTSSKLADSEVAADNTADGNDKANLMTFSDSSSSASLLTPDADVTVKEQIPQTDTTPDTSASSTAESDRIKQLESLASLDLSDVSKESPCIDEIFATNFVTGTASNAEGPIANHSEGKETSDKGRKRSKSSAFPIVKQREGVCISEDLLSKSLPHGKVVRSDTGLIEFIVDDLQEKIRRSSPMSKTASEMSSSRRSSDLSINSMDSFASSSLATSVTSGMSRSYPQSPDCIPPIDPIAIHEMENHARTVADNVDKMLANLKYGLHKMSAISVGCEEAYKTSVDVTCDSVDSSIKSMYALMAKCEELSQNMDHVNKLAEQIKEIKRLLDRFEGQLVDK